MHLRTLGLMVAAGMYLALSAAAGSGQSVGHEPSYRHGYFLFLAGTPNGCEDCYIPLLLTKSSLEELKAGPTTDDCVLITTYERDSIWHYEGLLSVPSSDINEAERKVWVLNRAYRYQEIGANEILRLLENPRGKIPISRPVLPSKLLAGPDLKELTAAFRAAKLN
jgi:hypothetical protein